MMRQVYSYHPILGDVQCERALLSSAWLAGDFVMIMRLDAADFIDPFCQWLLRHLRALVDAGEPLDMIALLRRVKKPGGTEGLTQLEEDSLPGSLAEVLATAPTPAHLEYYFRVLRTERLRRALCRLADAMRERIEKHQHDPAATLAWAGEQIDRLLTKVPTRNTAQDANGDETPDAAKAKAQPATVSPEVRTPDAAK